MKEKKRDIWGFGTAFVWGSLGLILALQTGKDIYVGEPLDIFEVGLLVVAILTTAGTLMGETQRIWLAGFWLLTSCVGFLFLILGAGLEIEWMLERSVGMLFGGLMTAMFIGYSLSDEEKEEEKEE